MSLDHTYEAMRHFANELRAFDEALKTARRKLENHHQAIDGLWTDSTRKLYDSAMSDLSEQLDAYAGPVSERFEYFVRSKLQQLAAYLEG